MTHGSTRGAIHGSTRGATLGSTLGSTLCRCCHSTNLERLIALGSHPPANAFRTKEELVKPEVRFDLTAYGCLDCGLLQIANQIPADFFTRYLYVPSGSVGLPKHFEQFAEDLFSLNLLGPDSLLIDVGCNEGLLLAAAKERGARVLGIDPAENIAERAKGRGLEVVTARLDVTTAQRVREQYGAARVVTTTNTLNHIDDLDEFVEAVATLLSDTGRFIIEVPHAAECLKHNEFDTIYQEHLSVFSVRSLAALCERHGLALEAVHPIRMHGGSLRVIATRGNAAAAPAKQEDAAAPAKKANAPAEPTAQLDNPATPAMNSLRELSIPEWMEREDAAGVRSLEEYQAFENRAQALVHSLRELLENLKALGKRVAAYGAPAKATTLLLFGDIGKEHLEFVVDRSPLKQGLFCAGTDLPVVPVEHLRANPPDYLLILAWNFADEIMQQLSDFSEHGGRFILPIPEPRVVDEQAASDRPHAFDERR